MKTPNAEPLYVLLPTAAQMPNILNIVRNEWLDDNTTFEFIAGLPEMDDCLGPDPHLLMYVTDALENLVSGNIIDAYLHGLGDEGLSGQNAYDHAREICTKLAEQFIRGGEVIQAMIRAAWPDDFFSQYTTTEAILLPNGDLGVKYRRRE